MSYHLQSQGYEGFSEIDREGNVADFEPTDDMKEIENCINALS